MSDEPEHFPLDHFLGLQRLTHVYVGNSVVLGFDGVLYRISRVSTPCPDQAERFNRETGHSPYCRILRLGQIRRLLDDEWQTMSLVIDTSKIELDRMVMVYKRPDENMLYVIDESWGTMTSGKLLLEIGERNTEEHNKFLCRFNELGIEEAPKPETI